MFQSTIAAYSEYVEAKPTVDTNVVTSGSHSPESRNSGANAADADATVPFQRVNSNRSLSSLDSSLTSYSARKGSFNSMSSFDQSVDVGESEEKSSRISRVRAAARSFLRLDKSGKSQQFRCTRN